MSNPFAQSLCPRCAHARQIISGKGSQFLLCRQSQTDPRFPKYPPQPVLRCPEFEVVPPSAPLNPS